MPKKKSTQTLQSCNCCGYQSANVWNHIEKSKECKKFYYDNRQFHIPPIFSDSKPIQTPSNKKRKHHQNSKQSSSTHAMFGQHVSLDSINPFINYVDNECNSDNDFSICDDDHIDDDNLTKQKSSITMKTTHQTSNIQSLNVTLHDYSVMSSNMNSLITNSVFNPATLLSMKLFKILNKANAPLYLFDELHTFIKHSVPILQNSKTSTLLKRNKLLSTLYSIIFNGSQLTNFFRLCIRQFGFLFLKIDVFVNTREVLSINQNCTFIKR